MTELLITLVAAIYWFGYYWCEAKHDTISCNGTFASHQDKLDWHHWDAGEKALTLLAHTAAVQVIVNDWTYSFLFLAWSMSIRYFLHEYLMSKFWKNAKPFGYISSSDAWSLFIRKIFGEQCKELITWPAILSSIVIVLYSFLKWTSLF